MHDLHLPWSRDLRAAIVPEHVDLGAHAEAVEIQSRLDGEPGAWQDPPFVVRLVVVEVHAVAVDTLSQAVTGPMQDVGAVPRLLEPAKPNEIED